MCYITFDLWTTDKKSTINITLGLIDQLRKQKKCSKIRQDAGSLSMWWVAGFVGKEESPGASSEYRKFGNPCHPPKYDCWSSRCRWGVLAILASWIWKHKPKLWRNHIKTVEETPIKTVVVSWGKTGGVTPQAAGWQVHQCETHCVHYGWPTAAKGEETKENKGFGVNHH